jgi:ABC-type polysaccharide/polyol phosphate transport system ATPase subunit
VAILEVSGVSKRFSIPSARRDTIREHFFGLLRPRTFEELVVLDQVSFSVERGESLGIMGRNGSGKSTLLKILAGIYQADAGTVAVRAPVTPILQLGLGWNGELSARDNLYLTGTAMGLTLAEVADELDEIMAFAGLARFLDVELKHFSTGMAARLAYAIAFKAVREVLLLDEIFAVGDAEFGRRCEERYRKLHDEGRTVVLVSHNPEVVARHCERALLLEGGRIVLDDRGAKVAEAYVELLGGRPLRAAAQ